METAIRFTPVSTAARWISYFVSAVPCLLLTFSAAMKLIKPPGIEEGFAFLGWPVELATPLGILESGCVVVYLIPRTAVLGAILVTAYMGGAVATHVRIGDAFIIQVCLGILVWFGIWLRIPRLRELIPLHV
jgi:hypothetical protein